MTKVYTNDHAEINGINVWFHVVTTDIGNIWIVQHETSNKDVLTDLFFDDYDKAIKKYLRIVYRLLKEKRESGMIKQKG